MPLLPPVQEYNAVGRVIISSEAYALHEATLKTRLSEYSRVFRVRVLAGALIRAADYITAQRRRTDLIAATAKAFEKFDVLITAPTAGARAAAERAAAGRRVRPALAHDGGECRGGPVDGGVRRLHRGGTAAGAGDHRGRPGATRRCCASGTSSSRRRGRAPGGRTFDGYVSLIPKRRMFSTHSTGSAGVLGLQLKSSAKSAGGYSASRQCREPMRSRATWSPSRRHSRRRRSSRAKADCPIGGMPWVRKRHLLRLYCTIRTIDHHAPDRRVDQTDWDPHADVPASRHRPA